MDSRQAVRAMFFMLALYGIQIALFPGPTVRVAIQLALYVGVLLLFFLKGDLWQSFYMDSPEIIALFFIYGCATLLRGMYLAESYEQWRYLVTIFLPTVFLPIFCLIGSKPQLLFVAVRTMIVFSMIFCLVYIIQGPKDKLSNIGFFVYVSFLFPLLTILHVFTTKLRIIIILFSIVSFFFDITNRTNMASIAISAFFGMVFFLSRNSDSGLYAMKRFILFGRYIFLLAPIILVAAGLFANINIFKLLDNSEDPEARMTEGIDISTVDSRTNIYEDAYLHILETGNWLFGSGPSVAIKTSLSKESEDYKDGRLGGSESSLLTYFVYGGVVYVFLLFLIFWYAGSLAIYKSNSWAIRLIGLYLSARWTFSFVENPLDLNNYWVTTFLLLGACFSPAVRALSDEQIEYYCRYNVPGLTAK